MSTTDRRIRITAGAVTAGATLNTSPTAMRIWEALPIEAKGETWGDEIYFGIPITAEVAKDAKEVVDPGDLSDWPPGSALCIFFGPTPSSRTPNEIRPYSAVNVVGKVSGNPTMFKQVRSGARVLLERA